MLRLAAFAACLMLVLPAGAAPKVSFQPPAGKWRASTDGAGNTTFHLKKKAHIVLHAPEPSPEDAAAFKQGLEQSPPADLSNPGEVQLFTSPDGRAVVALDGTAEEAQPTRRCWVFHRGQRVLVELTARDDAEFKRAEAGFMGVVASIKVVLGPAATPQITASQGPDFSPAGATGVGSGPAASAASTVASTLHFAVPTGWTRTDVANAVWLSAPGTAAGTTYVLLTPAERLSGDFGAWFQHRLVPPPGMEILSRGEVQHVAGPRGGEVIRQRLTVRVRGEKHEQLAVAEHRGAAAVLVALDAPSPEELTAHQPVFRALLAGLAIDPALAAVAPSSGAAVGAFPSLDGAGWSLTRSNPTWRSYRPPTGACTLAVSQVTPARDALDSLNTMRRSMGFTEAIRAESMALPGGAQVLRVVDPDSPNSFSNPVETAVLSSNGKQVFFVLRAPNPSALRATQREFERLLGLVHL